MGCRIFIVFISIFCWIIIPTYAQVNCTEQPLFHGDGTYYGATGAGNCSFDQGTNNLMVGAMNREQYNGSNACGTCVSVKGPKGTIDILITDQCPECKKGDIDLSEQAFEKIADKIAGRVPIEWKYIPCPINNNLYYKYKEGSSQWWIGVQIRNHRYGLAKLEYKNSKGIFTEIPRRDYNYFVADGGIDDDKNKTGPYHFRLTDIHGQVIDDSNVSFNLSQIVNGNVQFPECKPTGRWNVTEPQQMLVYPNPFENELTFLATDDKVSTFKLLNLQGKILTEGNLMQINSYIAQLTSGIYLLEINNQKYVKLIKR